MKIIMYRRYFNRLGTRIPHQINKKIIFKIKNIKLIAHTCMMNIA